MKTLKENPFFTIFEKLHNSCEIVNQRSFQHRKKILTSLEKALLHNRSNFREALHKDFKKPFSETDLTEIYPVLSEIRHAKANLRNWMRPEIVSGSLPFIGTKSKITRKAKGVCLIISPWNYPVNLTLSPLVSAIAGGNTVLIKPSEFTPYTSQVIKSVIESICPADEMSVIEGDSVTAEHLLKLPFDHIFFTGSTEKGKMVMQSAVKNLSSVTLELGGKSPVYIHNDADIADAVVKITAAKLVNAGQTCIAPDYIIVHEKIRSEIIKGLKSTFKMFYDTDKPDDRKNYTSIINNHHYERLEKLSPDFVQQKSSKNIRLFEPVLIENSSLGSVEMQEEIFGPIIPVISVRNEDDAIQLIKIKYDPLCINVFTRNSKIKNKFINTTRSGTLSFNECAVHFLNPRLPFGGIHQSGIGRSHGKAGFLSFTDEVVIFEQRVGFTMAKLLYPPYGKYKKILINLLLKYF